MILMEDKIGEWRIVIHLIPQTTSDLPTISFLRDGRKPWDGLASSIPEHSGIFQPWWISWSYERPEAEEEDYPPEVWNLACEMIRRMKKLRSFQ